AEQPGRGRRPERPEGGGAEDFVGGAGASEAGLQQVPPLLALPARPEHPLRRRRRELLGARPVEGGRRHPQGANPALAEEPEGVVANGARPGAAGPADRRRKKTPDGGGEKGAGPVRR